MIDEATLKQRLLEIAAEDYRAPTRPEGYPLILAMGTHMGSPDPQLRDDLIYMTMATWIERDAFEAEELIEILGVVLNKQHLFLDLGEIESDSVFMRSFSLLIVAAILEAHRRRRFLPTSELKVIKSKLLRYLAAEKDLRGYVPGNGWAHAAAHAADALEQLVQCENMEGGDLREVLQAMRSVIGTSTAVYVCEEDERLVTAVLAAWFRPEIGGEVIVEWLNSIAPMENEGEPFEKRYTSFVNNKNFLRSMTFRIHGVPLVRDVRQALSDAVGRFSRF